MKKTILNLEGVEVLSKKQMRRVDGGVFSFSNSFADMPCGETPEDKCSTNAECEAKKRGSYCFLHYCESGGATVSFMSCQYVRD